MKGLYIHIPYCKQVCYYCDFYFRVATKDKAAILKAIQTELALQKNYFNSSGKPLIHTLYLGGGTPSVLTINELHQLIETVYSHYRLMPNTEVTLEANPDDLTPNYLEGLKQLGINRLSIGVQSFFDDDLRWMNRRHTSSEAIHAIQRAQKRGFHNINIDLIYGLPSMTEERWKINLSKAFSLDIPHLSAYHLTIEERTVFGVHRKRNIADFTIPENDSIQQFDILMDWAESSGFEHYEISNFAKPGHYSNHNCGYWQRKPYIGIGPSAHSYNRQSRQWNVSNNSRYIETLMSGQKWFEREELTETDQYNDYIMLSLRTKWGIDRSFLYQEFGQKFGDFFLQAAQPYLQSQHIETFGDIYRLNRKGKLIADRIASDLFYIND